MTSYDSAQVLSARYCMSILLTSWRHGCELINVSSFHSRKRWIHPHWMTQVAVRKKMNLLQLL